MENSQAIAIRVESREDDPKYIKSMDFFILVDGKSDNTLYRMEEGTRGFRKLYSIGKSFGYTVRGKIKSSRLAQNKQCRQEST